MPGRCFTNLSSRFFCSDLFKLLSDRGRSWQDLEDAVSFSGLFHDMMLFMTCLTWCCAVMTCLTWCFVVMKCLTWCFVVMTCLTWCCDTMIWHYFNCLIKRCHLFLAGYDKYPYQYVSGKLQATINFPGTFNLDFHSKSSQDLPDDLVMKFRMKKFEPFTYDVPCFAGLGSWYLPITLSFFLSFFLFL